jgi:hypothetical protein
LPCLWNEVTNLRYLLKLSNKPNNTALLYIYVI